MSGYSTGYVEWKDYLDVTVDVLPWLQMSPADVGSPMSYLATNLAGITSMVCTRVQQELGQPIAPTQFTRRFDGWSSWQGAYIELPYYPVISIDTVTEYQGSSGAIVLQESTPPAQTDGFQIDPLVGRLTRVFPGNVQKPWYPGSRNVEVTWTAGFANTPPDLKIASLEWVAAWWRNKQQGSALTNGSGYDADEMGDSSNDQWSGMPASIRSIIAGRQQIGIG